MDSDAFEYMSMQGNIRSTFRALHDVVKAQGQAIRNLEAALESKAQYTEVAAKMAGKADNKDVDRWNDQLSQKLDRAAVDAICDRRLSILENSIIKRLSVSVSEVVGSVNSSVTSLRTEVGKQVERIHEVLENRVSEIHRDVAQRLRTVEMRMTERCGPLPVPDFTQMPGVVLQADLDKAVHALRTEVEMHTSSWNQSCEMQKRHLQVSICVYICIFLVYIYVSVRLSLCCQSECMVV